MLIFLVPYASLRANDGLGKGGDARPQKEHKVRVADPVVASELIEKGGHLVSDYGTFRIIQVEDKAAAELAGRKGVEEVSHQDVIALNAGPLDTTKAEIKALRQPVAASEGKKLHLVHFAGPVKPEWRDQLEKTGVSIIAYIPQNAYLVYGHGSALRQMQAWAAKTPFVQWEGPYSKDYKIHPRARSSDAKGNPRRVETDVFAIQLVATIRPMRQPCER